VEDHAAPRSGAALPARVIRRDDDSRAGIAAIDVPLNDGQGDITALFEFRPLDGRTAVALYDLRAI
jgi:hypothetical protein